MIQINRYFKSQLLLQKAKKKPINILWFPKITSSEDLMRELSRATWYLYPILKYIENITFVIDKSLEHQESVFPNYVDKNIASMYANLKKRILFQLENNIKKYDVIIEWSYTKQKNTINTSLVYIKSDVHYHQFDSTKLIKFTNKFLTTGVKKENNDILKNVLNKLKYSNHDSTLLVGSGPSVDKLQHNDISNPITIVCNSVVKNTELLKKYNPQIIVATDSVFHAGYSLYASKFREKLCEVLQNYPNAFFFVPLRDLQIYKSNLPAVFSDRIVGLKGINTKSFNINILKNQFVKTTSNVLTFFLLPIASTLSNTIYLIGFDGKKVEEKNTFWSYSKASQFNDTLDNVKVAHPAFYKVDYENYNKTHTAEVKSLVETLIQRDFNLINIASSNISTLNDLYNGISLNE